MDLTQLSFDPSNCFINGKWIKPVDKKTLTLTNPSTGGALCQISRGTSADINLAVIAAQNALEGEWGHFTAVERGRILS